MNAEKNMAFVSCAAGQVRFCRWAGTRLRACRPTSGSEKYPSRVVTTARLLPLRPEVVARVVPVVANAAQTQYFMGDKSKILDRVLLAAVGAVLLLLFGGGLSKALRLILYVGCALLPILLPFSKACLHNTRLRTHPYTGVFLGATTSSATPIAAGRIRVSIADVDGEAAAEGTADSASGRVRLGMVGFALVVADDAGFGRFRGVGAVYVPEAGAWVGDYPYVRRRYFQEVSVHADLVARASPWQSGA